MPRATLDPLALHPLPPECPGDLWYTPQMHLDFNLSHYDHTPVLELHLLYKRDMLADGTTIHFPEAPDMPGQVCIKSGNDVYDVYDFLSVQRARYAPDEPPRDISRACAQCHFLMRQNERRGSYLCALARAGIPAEHPVLEQDLVRVIATRDLALVLDHSCGALLDPSCVFALHHPRLSTHEKFRMSRDPQISTQFELLLQVQHGLASS